MRRLVERTVPKFGRCLGHRAGFNGEQLLDYLAACKAVCPPAHEYVLRERLADELAEQQAPAERGAVQCYARQP
jgi:hypothetical protein